MRQVALFEFHSFNFLYVSPTTKQKQRENKIYLVKKQTSVHENINPTLLHPSNGARKDLDNPQVLGIIVAIPKGGSDKYGVSNPQGAKGKINILSSPICH